jgi:hypothetical protein
MQTQSDSKRLGIGIALAAGVLAAALIASGSAEAQPPKAATGVAAVAPADKLSPELQQALKAGKKTEAKALLRQRPGGGSGPAASGAVVGNPPSTPPQPYVCQGSTCTCAGSYDCVKMIAADEACKEGTVGCNDSGCTCTAK